ncbi:MAG: RNA polymerase-associated protein rapA [Magnetococcales bacterium]|nr:RNA polymerase-associated protein rapA [Magnetococcales bacterium]
MTKSSIVGMAALFALVSSTAVWAEEEENPWEAEWEVSGYLKNETAFFTGNGPTIGELRSTNTTSGQDAGDMLKFENALNLFINGEFSYQTSLHAQLNLVYDTEGVTGYKGHSLDSQHDIVRELYVDTVANGIDLRIGKQQVVWGTADGIKLLDIVNPTDWREFVQNTTEDARLPVWMIKAETDMGETGNFQFILSQRKENAIPGMNGSGDISQPFKMKGVDSITGPVNGFLNLVPALGAVSNTFWGGATVGFGSTAALSGVTHTTVQNFVDGSTAGATGFLTLMSGAGYPCNGLAVGAGATSANATCLNNVAQATNNQKTNLIDGGGSNWDSASNPNSTFEYMPNATFATFDAFVNASSEYRKDYPGELAPNVGFRIKDSIGSNFNFSLNYLWHYDANPYIDMHWEGSNGNRLNVNTSADPFGTGNTTVTLADDSGARYGGSAQATDTTKKAKLVFVEKLNRIHSVGSSFDYAADFKAVGPVVFRGEFLYQADTKTPVIDRTKLGYGDLVGGMKMEDADMFKYVLGADFTFFTNMMVSGQFIQFVNLDFIDEGSSNRYTADPTVMHLSNGLQKGRKYKEFYSIFFSKPFGEEQQGRWNNIFMIEEGGGYWNRFDVEYAYTDELILSSEYNAYFGEEETMFGQFTNSSNVQVGLKYLF